MIEEGPSPIIRQSFRSSKKNKPSKEEFEKWLIEYLDALSPQPSRKIVIYKNVKL